MLVLYKKETTCFRCRKLLNHFIYNNTLDKQYPPSVYGANIIEYSVFLANYANILV